MRNHHYNIDLVWTGNKGEGTRNYQGYDRSHKISAEHKPTIEGSSDVAFKGDKTKYSPEDMLVASLSACHMLWYLHLCADAGVVVTAYTDHTTGTLVESHNGGGRFTEVVLHPRVTVLNTSMVEKATEIHHQANKMCFIANSCNFPVRHAPITVEQDAGLVS